MSESEKKGLVPYRRFPEFCGTGGWEKHPLSKFIKSLDAGVSVNSGDRPANKDESGVLKTSAVTNGVFESSENKVVLDPEELKRLKEPVSENTIIISRMNTPALVGANAYIEADLENIYLPDRLWAAKPKADISMRFIAYILGSVKGRAALSELATGTSGSMKNISKTDVLELPVVVPRHPEQQKIADCLTSIDELITAQTQKLDALKTHKKGLMQQLFPAEGETTPKLRFPEFRNKGGWNTNKLGSIGRVIRGASPRPQGDPRYYGGPVPRLMVQDVTRDGKWVTPQIDSLTLEGAKLSRPCPAGTLTIVCSGTVGVISFLAVDACIHDGFLALVDINESIATKDFLFHSLSILREQFERGATHGGVFTNLTTSGIEQFEISCPSSPEQQRISDCLDRLDDLITAQTQKLDALKTHKKGLMQQLFPAMSDNCMDDKAGVSA